MLSLLLFPFFFCLCRLHQRTIHTNQFHTPSHHVGHMQLLHQVRFLCVLAWSYCSCTCLLSNVSSVGFSDHGHIWNWLLLSEHALGTGFYLFFHDSRIDKKRNILTYFPTSIRKFTNLFWYKIFKLWEALWMLDKARALALL